MLATDPQKVVPLLEQQHTAYLGAVPLRTIVRFTLLQLALLAGVWALVTWAGVSGGGADGVQTLFITRQSMPQPPKPSLGALVHFLRYTGASPLLLALLFRS